MYHNIGGSTSGDSQFLSLEAPFQEIFSVRHPKSTHRSDRTKTKRVYVWKKYLVDEI